MVIHYCAQQYAAAMLGANYNSFRKHQRCLVFKGTSRSTRRLGLDKKESGRLRTGGTTREGRMKERPYGHYIYRHGCTSL